MILFGESVYKWSILLIILIMISVSIIKISISFANNGDSIVYINWIEYSNPSSYNDWSTATCIYEEYIYVIGVQRNATQHPMIRIEKRSKYNGTLVSYNTYGFGVPFSCIFIGDYLYVVGANISSQGDWQWIILEIDRDLNILRSAISNPSIGWDWAFSIDTDGRYLYIAGFDQSLIDIRWRVEKWRIDNLSMEKEYVSRPSMMGSWAFGITYNSITKQLWVTGYYYDSSIDTSCWRIEILDTNLTLVKAININVLCGAGATTTIFDDYGNGYVIGNGIALIDSSGELVNYVESDAIYFKALIVNNRIYVIGITKQDNYWRIVLDIYTKDLEFVDRVTLPCGNYNCYVYRGRVAFDGLNIYFTGYDEALGVTNERWIIYSLKLSQENMSNNIYTGTLVPRTTILVTNYIFLERTITETITIEKIVREAFPTTIIKEYTQTPLMTTVLTTTLTIKEKEVVTETVVKYTTIAISKAPYTLTITNTKTIYTENRSHYTSFITIVSPYTITVVKTEKIENDQEYSSTIAILIALISVLLIGIWYTYLKSTHRNF